MTATVDVLDRHLKCFGEGDLEGLLVDYAPEALFFTPAGLLKTPDTIRSIFQRILAEFAQPGTTLVMRQLAIEGDYAYIVWSAESAANLYEIGTDTFVIRNGKIVMQTFAAKITSKH
jgi:ketosteroid isomerase-like protein